MIKKAFTLIELLVVIAIIGILAAVGTPIFQGFIQNAKIAATQENHIRVRDFIAVTFARCGGGSEKITFPGYTTISCNMSVSNMDSYFVHYFNYYAGFINPHNKNEIAVYKYSKKCLWLGVTCLYGSGNDIYISTNISDEFGNHSYLKEILIKE